MTDNEGLVLDQIKNRGRQRTIRETRAAPLSTQQAKYVLDLERSVHRSSCAIEFDRIIHLLFLTEREHGGAQGEVT